MLRLDATQFLQQTIEHDCFLKKRDARKATRVVPAPKPADDAAVLSKAVVRAARLLSFSQRDVARILGVSDATASRLAAGHYQLSSTRAKEWELALLLVRLFRSLDALVGPRSGRAHVAHERESRARGAPGRSSPFRRRPGPCRQLPGQRARSPLAPRALRHALWRAGRGAARGVDDGARRFDRGAACAGAPARRREACDSRRPRRISTGCCSRRSAIRRRLAARAFAARTIRACSTAPTQYGPPAPSWVTGGGATLRIRRRLTAMPTKPQTVFQVKIETDAVDLRAKPFARDRRHWTDAGDYSRCQALRPHGARGWRRRHPLRVRPRSEARRMLRGAVARRVRLSESARAADVDAVGRPRPRDLAAHARARRSKSTNSPPRNGRPPRTRPHRVRAHVARDAGVHGGARTPARRTRSGSPSIRPVYTLGLAGRREHLLRDNGIPTLKVDRGGQITYHGPGQLVVYLLLRPAARASSASARWSGRSRPRW